MNWDQVKGNWRQLKGEVQRRWGKLTNDDLDVIQGDREKLIGRIQERYGTTRDKIEREVDNFWTEHEPVGTGGKMHRST